ncbi:MAG: hypothetical protein HFF18_09720 [Oscillospiraceae bacterium]|nr:hypothetical protein [Oscillospiraceae bacterium]
MKLTKRISALLLAGSLALLTLAGCGGKDTPPATNPPATNPPAPSTSAPPPAATGSGDGMTLTTENQTYVLSTQGVDTAVYTRVSAFVDVAAPLLGSNTIAHRH